VVNVFLGKLKKLTAGKEDAVIFLTVYLDEIMAFLVI
jgi:hypothetical protein